MVLVEMNWNTMEYAALSQPNIKPKIARIAQLKPKMTPQMVLPVWLETHSAIKSVPPVDAPDLSAMAAPRPETTPPKIMSMILSPKNGAK